MTDIAEIKTELEQINGLLKEANAKVMALALRVPNLQITGRCSEMTRGFSCSYPIFKVTEAKIASLL
jgi:hypothetical protein